MAEEQMTRMNSHASLCYCESAKVRELLMRRSEDLELNVIADARLQDGKVLIEMSLDSETVGKRERNAVYRAAAKR
jgi:hypothetical protein